MINLHDENEKTSWQPKYGYRLPFLMGDMGARKKEQGSIKKYCTNTDLCQMNGK